MPTDLLARAATVVATLVLASLVTASAAIAASGIGHSFSRLTRCVTTSCSPGPYQAKPAHVAHRIDLVRAD